jgi:hypothetical protein
MASWKPIKDAPKDGSSVLYGPELKQFHLGTLISALSLGSGTKISDNGK